MDTERVLGLRQVPTSLGGTVWREASGEYFVQLSAGVSDHIVCNICGATPVSGEASD